MTYWPHRDRELRKFSELLRTSSLTGAAIVSHALAAFVIAALLSVTHAARAADVTAAVAANFTAPAQDIADAFQKKTGNTVTLSFGASGQLYAQITQGAPFDVFLSADAARPRAAETAGWGAAGRRFTYAIGKLVLWSADPAAVDAAGSILKKGTFRHIAIANPKTAPYGAAGIEVLQNLDVYKATAPKIITGENISQTLQFVASGNAEIGFVALSQVIAKNTGSRWLVPEDLYSPILQDAILLKTGQRNAIAKAFMAFLKSGEAREIIARYGYALPRGQ